MSGGRRPIYKSLIDALVFLAFLALVMFGLYLSGLLQPETGALVAVDGDSLRKDGADYRLYGIDAPELHQTCKTASGEDYPCGREAARQLAGLIRDQTLTCAPLNTDRYGRDVVICKAGALDIANEMIKRGWAVAYTSHSLDYVSTEREARNARRGIWQGRFENPQDWRADHRREPFVLQD